MTMIAYLLIFPDAEWQKLVASSSNNLPFLMHPQKSLFPRNPRSRSKSTFYERIINYFYHIITIGQSAGRGRATHRSGSGFAIVAEKDAAVDSR